MTSKHKPCNTSTKEFKLEAIRLMDVSDRPGVGCAVRTMKIPTCWHFGAHGAPYHGTDFP